MDDIFDEAHRRSGHGAVSKGGQQSGKLREIQLDKSRHDGDAQLDEHQNEANGAEHGSSCQFAGVFGLCGHGVPFRQGKAGSLPDVAVKFYEKTPC